MFTVRKSNRLHNFDYSSVGWYYVTVCTHNNVNYFSRVENYSAVKLSEIGRIVDTNWKKIPEHFENVEIGEYKIMPNHVHGIVKIQKPLLTKQFRFVGANFNSPKQQGAGGNPSSTRDPPLQKPDVYTLQHIVGAGYSGPNKNPSLGQVIGYFKYQSTKQINEYLMKHKCLGAKTAPLQNKINPHNKYIQIWQRSFYDRIIRTEKELQNILHYIHFNERK